MDCQEAQIAEEMLRHEAADESLRQGQEAHLRDCPACREYRELAGEIDLRLATIAKAAVESPHKDEARASVLGRVRRLRRVVWVMGLGAFVFTLPVLWFLGLGWFLAFVVAEGLSVTILVCAYRVQARHFTRVEAVTGDFIELLQKTLDTDIARTRRLSPLIILGGLFMAVWIALELRGLPPLRLVINVLLVFFALCHVGLGAYLLRVQLPRLKKERADLG